MSDYPDIGPDNPNSQLSGYLTVRKSDYQNIRISVHPFIRISDYPEVRLSNIKKVKMYTYGWFPLNVINGDSSRCFRGDGGHIGSV